MWPPACNCLTYVVPVTPLPAWFPVVVGVANAVLVLVLCAVVAAAIPAALALRRLAKRATEKGEAFADRVNTEMIPVLHDAAKVVSNLNAMAKTLHKDLESVHETVSSANAAVRDAITGAEDRMARLGALADIVEEEAEDVLFSAIAAARGVRAGTAALRRGVGAALTFDSGESSNGDQRRGPAGDGHERPRVRPRRAADQAGDW